MTRLTKPIFGIDSYEQIPASIHHEVYSKFAGRYSSHQSGKAVTAAEYRHDRDNDIGLVSVFEDSATNSLNGYDQGKADATFAEKQTREAGRPEGRPIYFAVDTDVSADVEKISAYFDGVAAVLGREHCGGYGGYSTVAYLFDKGFKWGWQTLAWSYGKVDKRAQIYQYEVNLSIAGLSVDYDHAYYEDFGQWEYKPAPVHQYDRFYRGPFHWRGHVLREREAVEEFDKLIKHPIRNKKKLAESRVQLKLCADRIASLASRHREPGKVLPAAWSPFDRDWRYTNIIRRYHGKEK